MWLRNTLEAMLGHVLERLNILGLAWKRSVVLWYRSVDLRISARPHGKHHESLGWQNKGATMIMVGGWVGSLNAYWRKVITTLHSNDWDRATLSLLFSSRLISYFVQYITVCRLFPHPCFLSDTSLRYNCQLHVLHPHLRVNGQQVGLDLILHMVVNR